MKLCQYLAAAVFGIGIFASSSAQAGFASSSMFSNFRYEIHDLTPDDGVDPWVSIGWDVTYATNTLEARGCCFTPIWADEIRSSTSPGKMAWQAGNDKMHSTANGMAVDTFASAVATGISLHSYAASGMNFLLGQNTRVVISVDWLGAHTNDGDGYGYSAGFFSLLEAATMTGTELNEYLWAPGQVRRTFTGELSSGDDLMSAWVTMHAYADSNMRGTYVPNPDAAVPEPASLALTLGGLAGLAALRRRRQK